MPALDSGDEAFAIMQQKTKSVREKPTLRRAPVEDEDELPPAFFRSVWGFVVVLISELLVHGFLISFIGAYVGSWMGDHCKTAKSEGLPFLEMLLTMATVTALINYVGTYYATFECSYFNRYYIHAPNYQCMLTVRKMINGCFLGGSIWFLYCIVNSLIDEAGMKETFLAEKLGDVGAEMFHDVICHIKHNFGIESDAEEVFVAPKEPSWFSRMFWGSGESGQTSEDLEGLKAINSAKLILAVAMITCSIVRMLYLVMLSTYMQSVDIILKLQIDDCKLAEDDGKKKQNDDGNDASDEQEDSDTPPPSSSSSSTTSSEDEEEISKLEADSKPSTTDLTKVSDPSTEFERPLIPVVVSVSAPIPSVGRRNNVPRIIVELKRRGRIVKHVPQ